MARLTKKIGGTRGINWHVARTHEVSTALQRDATAAARRSEAILATHRHDGHARIDLGRGGVDWYIALDDRRGMDAAMSIEFGRKPDKNGKGGMEPVAPLRKGVGVPV